MCASHYYQNVLYEMKDDNDINYMINKIRNQYSSKKIHSGSLLLISFKSDFKLIYVTYCI